MIKLKIRQVKPEVEKMTGGTFVIYMPIEYATQVVAGINYFIKVYIGDGSFIHIRVHRDLKGNLSLHSVETDKTLEAPIAYF